MHVGIVGAGPAGLTAADALVQKGHTVTVFEQDARYVGGISRTVEYKGYRFDIGGHRFFSKNPDIEEYWTEVLQDDFLVRPRLSRIFYGGKFFDYPLKAGNAFLNMGLGNTMMCLVDYLRSRIAPRKPVLTFEDWVTNQFGARLFRMFFQTYTEKVWGIPCDEISADWAAQRIKGLNLATAVLSAVRPQRSSGSETVIKTLIDRFRYPKLGPGMLWERIAQRVVEAGGTLNMGMKIVRIEKMAAGGYRLQGSGQDASLTVEVDQLISSMPLRSLVRALHPAPPPAVVQSANALRYRDFLTVALMIDQPDLFPDNWIYIHDPSVKVGRIQNFKNWSPDMVPDARTTCLGLEYFCFEGDGLWNAEDATLIALAAREVAAIGLLQGGTVFDGRVVRVPKAYPVYDDGYAHRVATIRNHLADHFPDLQVIGRNGMHRYNNQDHAMLTGLLAARNLDGGRYDLWAVNGDAEYLEELPEERLVPRSLAGA
ncbi:MAG: NAD(P)/FAD-dependent oxidoreductase [Thermaerobacter sp.]|nr:NAD(P)/FAD-dependent oxidoreductase [Thermaerobacter sp.]